MPITQVNSLGFDGVLEVCTEAFADGRGSFLEAFSRRDLLRLTGVDFNIEQVNVSHSRRAVIRGVHFAQCPPGQAKFVMCTQGRMRDVIVDLRSGSSTFGAHVTCEISSELHNAVHVPAGFGHAFEVLSDAATIVYACDQPYSPGREFTLNPFDTELGIRWSAEGRNLLSARDKAAPSLAELIESRNLPLKDSRLRNAD